uniref:Uncharacterized protein n=1 Tax=Setaria italica TaxID=4555 RepID=K3YZ93_SETIT
MENCIFGICNNAMGERRELNPRMRLGRWMATTPPSGATLRMDGFERRGGRKREGEEKGKEERKRRRSHRTSRRAASGRSQSCLVTARGEVAITVAKEAAAVPRAFTTPTATPYRDVVDAVIATLRCDVALPQPIERVPHARPNACGTRDPAGTPDPE